MLRAIYLAMYAAFAALGFAMVARPGLLWFRSQGFFGVVQAWDVPLGALCFALCVIVALFTLGLALAVAFEKRRRVPVHAAFLLVVVTCIGARVSAEAPRPPKDPLPPLLEALRVAADELDARYDASYVPDAGTLNAALGSAQDPGFRHLARAVRPHARVLSGSTGPQLEALPEDTPATIYAAISQDRRTAWLTALGAAGIVRLANGKPAVIEAHGGSHNLPGRDPLVPLYPRTKH